jgi:hypothetical protein
MAPSIAEIPEKPESAPITVPQKAVPGTTETKLRIRRVIDEGGGTTTASVHEMPVISLGKMADDHLR